MKYRIILPAAFLLITIFFIAANLLGAGHGSSTFDFILFCAYPTAYVTDFLERFLGGPDLAWLLLGVVAGTIQYAVLGFLIDRFLQRRRSSMPGVGPTGAQ